MRLAADVLPTDEGVGGLSLAEVLRLKQFEEQNREFKQLVADLSLDKLALQDALKRKC